MGQVLMKEPMTTPATLIRVIPGRMDGIAAVYDACHQDLFGYAASLTRDLSSAEDIVHEAFARLVRETASGRPPDSARAWLYTVCTNLAFSGSRRRAIVDRWQRLVGRVAAGETGEAAEDIVLRHERQAELTRALDALPRDARAALLLAADGFSGREISTILDKSEGATRNILWRSRLILKDQLQDGDTA
jgi:RNA polymerase sigma-70 factor (ECF subfamily)